jgi:hypothetical protein
LAACLLSGKTFFKFKQVRRIILHIWIHYILYPLESSAYPRKIIFTLFADFSKSVKLPPLSLKKKAPHTNLWVDI